MPPELRSFQDHRARLFGLAYRMTGTVSDAEDILQEAWLRWMGQDRSAIGSPGAWLTRVVTRLCLDHLKSARRRRETYVGAWLPEPLVAGHAASAEAGHALAEEVSIALMLALDRLSPPMRAAFILRDAFDLGFDQIATALDRSEADCRQLVSRARRRMTGVDMVPPVALDQAQPLVEAFWRASRTGDVETLTRLLAEDVELHTDGGGKVPAAINVLCGRRRAVGFLAGLARKQGGDLPPPPFYRRINRAPGFVSLEAGGILQTTAFGLRDGRIAAIWVMRNPDKLRHLRAAFPLGV